MSVWPVDRRGAARLVGAAVLAWLILPTAPNFDTASHLVWARELLGFRSPDVDALSSPTLHPLWLLVAIPAAATGAGAALMQLIALIAFAVVIAGAFRIAADIAGTVAGVVAALATASSFALMLLAFKAYVDLPFVALVLTALVVEWRTWRFAAARAAPAPKYVAENATNSAALADGGASVGDVSKYVAENATNFAASPVSPLVVPGLLFVAGLLRPEAWAFGLLFVALRVLRDGLGLGAAGGAGVGAAGGAGKGLAAAGRLQAGPTLVVLAAPLLWFIADLLLTGSPFHSLTGTQALAEELGRPTGLARAPEELAVLLSDLARPPVAAAGLLGLGLAVWLRGWRRLLHPLVIFGAGCAGFLLVGALGLPLLQRYLLLPAVLVCVFAGVAAAVVIATALGRRVPPMDGVAAPTGGEPSSEAAGAPGARNAPAAGGPASSRTATSATSTESSRGRSSAPVAPALRVVAAGALVVGTLGVAGYLVLKADSFRIVGQGVLREATWQRQAAELLRDPKLIAYRRCGPVTLPTYRFVPELTLRAKLREGAIVSRATALGGAGPQDSGVAIVIEGNRAAKVRLGWAAGVPRETNTTPPGFTEVARRGPFLAVGRCSAPAG